MDSYPVKKQDIGDRLINYAMFICLVMAFMSMAKQLHVLTLRAGGVLIPP